MGTPPGMDEEKDDSHKMVWVKEGSLMRPIQIETGITDGSNIEIISGLKEGDEVVVAMKEGVEEEVKVDNTSDKDSEMSSPFMPSRSGKGGPRR